jgi:hypothetical protein
MQHRLSDFKKLYVTLYLMPTDSNSLTQPVNGIYLTGDPAELLKKQMSKKPYLAAIDKLKSKLTSLGFTLVNSPQEADAVAALRVEMGPYELFSGQSAGSASLRLIDFQSNDTLMIIFTEGSFISKNVDGEMNVLFGKIDAAL